VSGKCTPEYNAETRRLQKEAADLRAVIKAIDDGDFGRVIRAKAKEFAGDKALDSQGVVDKVREYVNQFAEHDEREVRDAISGYGQERAPRTLSDDQQRMKDIKKELREQSAREDSAPSKEEKARRTALKRELAEVKERIASGKYDKAPREPREWSPETKKMMADVEAEKLQLEKLKHSLALKNRTWPAKVKDATLAYSRSMILLGYHVLGKLAAYSAIEAGTLPLRALTSEILRRTPGLRDTFEKAPIAGGGFSAKAIKKAWGTMVDAETRKAMRDRLIRGFSDEDVLYGKKKDFQTPHPLLEMSGRLHEMIKTPLERAGFQYANEMYLAADLRELKRQDPSLTEEEAMDQATSTEATLARQAKSYAVGKEWVLKGDSELVNGWKAMLRALKGKEGDVRYALTNGLVSFLEYMEPIIKVPANLVSETASYTPLGLGKSGIAGIAHAIRQSKEIKALSTDEAEYIANNLVKGTLGSAAMAAYWYGRHGMTGYEQEGDYKKHPDREADTATIAGHKVGKWAFHHPLTAIGQLVATVGRVYDEKHSLGEGIRAGTTGLLDQLPFVNTLEYNGESLKDLPHFGKFLGKQASNFIPQAVKEFAKDIDPAKRRKTKTGTDVIQSSIPVARERLPRG